MHEHTSHSDPSMDTDYRATRYGSTDVDRNELNTTKLSSTRTEHPTHKEMSAYKNLIWMGLIHIPIMYGIMFAMVDSWGDIYQNLNTFYMALMMAAPMVAIMPFMMKEMYPNMKKNGVVVVISLLIIFAAFMAIRQQSAIGDAQFVRSMIPHHSGAILMCDEAKISDVELRNLCNQISQGQRKEIQQMQNILKRL